MNATAKAEERHTLDEAGKIFARTLNGRVWQLLERDGRSREDDEEMLHAAHASLFHWLSAGTGVNRQRGEWLIARVHTTLGNPTEALRHASRCLELTDAHRDEMEGFDFAFAYESMGRANALAGQRETSVEYRKRAEEAGKAISDPEDRKVFVDDFAGGDWYGIG